MKNLVKPYSLLFYLLIIIVFFFLGLIYAGLVDAAKNQGLAGGAIVLGYGVIAAFIGLLGALLAAYKLSGKIIVSINKILGLIILGFFAYFTWNYYTNVKPKRNQQQQKSPIKPKQATPTAEPIAMHLTTSSSKSEKHNTIMGLGMFSPNIFNH
jgi:uncharacterized membrane protein YebE (DUF533 family)